jgi:hypothetical protein
LHLSAHLPQRLLGGGIAHTIAHFAFLNRFLAVMIVSIYLLLLLIYALYHSPTNWNYQQFTYQSYGI